MRHDEETKTRVLRDVEALGIEEGCRRNGIHRATWYRWSKNASPPLAGARRSDEIRGRIAALAKEHPRWGCDRIAFFLSFEGVRISSPTVQKHLLALGLGRRSDRVAAQTQPPQRHGKRDDPSGAPFPSPDARGCG